MRKLDSFGSTVTYQNVYGSRV